MAVRLLWGLLHRLWLLAAATVVFAAVVVALGRELLPLASRFEPQLSAWLSGRLGVAVTLSGVAGRWRGLDPWLDVAHLQLGPEGALALAGVSARLDLAGSLRHRAPVWRALTVRHLELRLEENSEGRWTLGGRPLGEGGQGSLPLAMFTSSRLVRVEEAQIELAFYTGRVTTLDLRDLAVENEGEFHRLAGRVASSSEGGGAAELVFEGRGTPDDLARFTGRGYLRVRSFDLSSAWLSLFGYRPPAEPARLPEVEGGDLRFWFDLGPGGTVAGRGRLEAARLSLPAGGAEEILTALRADLHGRFQPGRGWELTVGPVRAAAAGEEIEPVALRFGQGVGRRRGHFHFAASRLDAAWAARLALASGLVPERAAEVLTALAPRGRLAPVAGELELRPGEPPRFRVRAQFRDLALDSWRRTPAVRGASGYLEVSESGGAVVLAGSPEVALLYPGVYDQFMPYANLTGKLVWRLGDDGVLRVTSNRLRIQGPEGRGRALVHLEWPLRGGAPQMILMAGLAGTDVRFLPRYLPRVLPAGLRRWLERAVVAGRLPEVGFLWRGSLKREASLERTVQLFARVVGGEVDYWPGWPAAAEVRGHFAVSDGRFDGHFATARLADLPVRGLAVTVRPSRTGPRLRARGELAADLVRARALLAATPLAATLGRLLALDARGPARATVDLLIPLAGGDRRVRHRVDLAFAGANLAVPGTPVEIRRIRGSLTWSSDAGLHSSSLEGSLFGAPLRVRADSAGGMARLRGRGRLEPEAVAAWLPGLADRFSGGAPLEGELAIPLNGGPLALHLRSDLRGLAASLPDPFGKSAGEAWPSELALSIAPGTVAATGHLGDRLAVRMRFVEGRLAAARLRLLAEQAAEPPAGALLVEGRLPQFRWQAWAPILARLGEGGAGGTPWKLDLEADSAQVGAFSLGETHLEGTVGSGAALALRAVPLAGRIQWDSTSARPRIELDRLDLSTPAAGAEAGLDPLQIPEFDLAVKALRLDGQPVGEVRFASRRVEGGVCFCELQGALFGVRLAPQPVGGEEEGEPEEERARLLWLAGEGGQRSRFTGTLEVDDIGELLARRAGEPPLTSRSGALYADLSWPGPPWQAQLLALEGYLGLELEGGSFRETAGGAADALLKLVGLVNFNTWLRRLRLDFSDFFSEGLSYDRLEGGLYFREGLVDFDEPLAVTMPSGRLHLAGTADLRYEWFEGRLVATLPVGTNLPWLAGLVGGLPAALGVYLTGKLLEKQVDRLSSIAYRVEGPLDAPRIRVEQIFSDGAAGDGGARGERPKEVKEVEEQTP
ncbi:MAG: TIGR02099 family protein [Porticoccaceae bacterium]|nr:MAG: TIGR02099 family protein [Porticoccaceae bacterium]